MIQQKQLPRHIAVSNNLSHTHNNSDSLINTSGLLFKPASSHMSSAPNAVQSKMHEINVRDSVIISMDTLPLTSLPHSLAASTAYAKRTETHALASSTVQKNKASAGSLGEVVWYTLAAGIVIAIYMVIPLMTTLIPLLTDIWSRLLMALEILVAIEFIVFCILIRTIR